MEMKKRRDVIDDVIIFSNNTVKIAIETNEMCFEIKKEITTDIAEAVAIMMTMDIEGLWNIEVNHNYDIDTEKCLYWLSGGNKEWSTLEHYNQSWVDCYYDFQDEFDHIVRNAVNKSNTLGDIKKNFMKYLSLPILYDFAVSKGLVR